jgi:hypothetical protein
MNGVSSLLGDIPLIGLSSPVGITSKGQHPNSVVDAYLHGDFQAVTHWLPGYAQSGRETADQLTKQEHGVDE